MEILQVNIQTKFTSRGIVFLSSTLPCLILSIISDIAFMRGSSLELDLPNIEGTCLSTITQSLTKADFHSVQNVVRSIFSERFLLKCVKSTTANEICSA